MEPSSTDSVFRFCFRFRDSIIPFPFPFADSGFRKPIFSAASKMTGKCFCLCFVVISLVLSLVTGSLFLLFQRLHYEMALPKLLLRPRPQHWNDPRIMEFILGTSALSIGLKLPSVESFIRASTTGNSPKGFALFLNLTNACQTLDDVSKVRTQVPKIALVTLLHKRETRCTLQELAENVQNAGYSLLIYFDITARLNPNSTSKAVCDKGRLQTCRPADLQTCRLAD